MEGARNLVMEGLVEVMEVMEGLMEVIRGDDGGSQPGLGRHPAAALDWRKSPCAV